MSYAGSKSRRPGSAVISLTAVLMVVLLGMIAFAVDIGYIAVARAEAQNGADAAALAGASRLLGKAAETGLYQSTAQTYYNGDNESRREAQRFGQLNKAGGLNMVLDLNIGNAPDGDIVIGYMNPNNLQQEMRFDVYPYNSVRVRGRRDTSHAGSLGLFFGRVLNREQQDVNSTATATLLSDPWGKLLPITMNIDDYRRLVDNKTDPGETDFATYNSDLLPLSATNFSNRVSGAPTAAWPDTVREFKLYPDKVGSPGNFGTVDLGILTGSVTDLRRQIDGGISASDRALMDLQGKLTADDRFVAKETAPVLISGDTGISWTIEDNLSGIIGQPRTIPLHKTVAGSGTNALYQIVGFVNVVVVYTNRSGTKEIFIQPTAPFTIFDSPDQNMLGKLMLTR
jgi:Flp pilus assembly protein TadG